MRRLRFQLAILVILCLFQAISSSADDTWPQWRGAAFDNISNETNLPAEFNKNKNVHWRFAMPGPGGASPVVWKDHVFVTSVNQSDNGLVLICLDVKGQQRWRKELKGSNQNVRMDSANSASPSPCTDGTHVWANSSAGFLQCFDFDGKEVWTVDLQDRYGEFEIQFGMTSTPILDRGRLYLQMIHGSMQDRKGTSTGFVVALEADSGKEIWRHERKTDGIMENKHSYASPTIVRDGDREYLVTHGGDYVIGHSLADGSELWRCGGINPKGNAYNPFLRFVASPVYRNGKLLVPSAKNGPVLCLKTDLSGDVTGNSEVMHWVLETGTPDVASPLYQNGLIFLARENGIMLCIDAENGEQVYKKRLLAGKHRSTPVFADDKVFVAGRNGTVLVLSADREGKVLAENDLDEEIKSSPAIADGRIYIRTSDALYCFGN